MFASVILMGLLAPLAVETDYAAAYTRAQAESKMLVVAIGISIDLNSIEARHANEAVFCQLDDQATMEIDGKPVRLATHSSFDAMEGRGVAVVDLKNDGFKGGVVSLLPARHCSSHGVETLVSLPAGTLTQRTLTWAMRMHPENPQSAWSIAGPELMAHAERHSGVQARTNNQHHNLPVGIASSEIVAESWPWNHNVVDAAIDIVGSWRQSPGHWGAARRTWSYFGYDMKTNGNKWFATGVFR
ncbi:hypothetical protein K2X85_01205 [bacterium]|jgi:hypothetical protein|nr:hypothetical protein [bacterium]